MISDAIYVAESNTFSYGPERSRQRVRGVCSPILALA